MPWQNCKIAGVNVDSKTYHAMKAGKERGTPEFVMSPSQVVAFARLPSRWRRGWSPPDSKAKAFGDLIDCRTLTPQLFADRYAIEPATYQSDGMECPECKTVTKSQKCKECQCKRVPVKVEKEWRYGSEFCDGWRSEAVAAGRAIVSARALEDTIAAERRLFEVVDGDDTIQRWFDASERQVLITGEWLDEKTGMVIPASCLMDFVPRADSEFASSLGDLKCVRSAHPQKFGRQSFDFGWHIQGAWDMDMFNAATGQGRNTWCFVLVENFAPWEPSRALYGQEGDMGNPGFIELGRDDRAGYVGIMANYCQCMANNKWPGYSALDESVQGWSVLRPEPFQAQRTLFAPRFDFTSEGEEEQGQEPVFDNLP